MLNIVIDAPATLRRFLDARSKGASPVELEELQRADEAARANNQPEARPRAAEPAFLDFNSARRRNMQRAARQSRDREPAEVTGRE